MSFAALETSVYSGQPVELLQFTRGLSAWRYCTADADFTHLSHLFEHSYAFDVPECEQSGEIAKGQLAIKTPVDTPVVLDLIASPLIARVDLTIYRRHRGDAEVVEWWHGYVADVHLADGEATITCQQAGSWLKRTGHQRPAQRQCPHALYDIECGLPMAAWATTGALISASGAVLVSGTFATHPDGYWTGGMIDAAGTLRLIVEHVSDTVYLTSAIPGLAPAAPFTVYPGCAHDPATCDGTFSNIENYGGLPWLPVKDPFVGDKIF